MKKQGKSGVYLPRGILDEIDDIKRENNLTTNREAFSKIVEYTRVARELERIWNLDWSKKIKRPKVKSSMLRGWKRNDGKKKKKSLFG